MVTKADAVAAQRSVSMRSFSASNGGICALGAWAKAMRLSVYFTNNWLIRWR